MKANNILKAKLFLEENQGYLKWGKEKLADKLNVSIHEIIAAKQMLWAEEDAEVLTERAKQYRKGIEGKKAGGMTASSRADGCCVKGKTKGRMC